MTDSQKLRSKIIASARSWLGTPYHHQASAKGIGCDCLGLIRGVWRDCIGPEPEAPPNYSRDWGEANGQELMLEAFRKFMIEISLADIQPGDALVIRWKPTTVAKHCCILVSETKAIQAIGYAPVYEFFLSSIWRRRMTAAFKFPGT